MAYNNADLELIATLDESSSKAEILKAIKVLNKRLKANENAKIKLGAKIDTRDIQIEINRLKALLKAKSKNDTNINIKGNVDSNNIISSVNKATKDAQKTADKNTVQVSLSLKKDKLINDIKVFGQQNTKMFKDANMTAKFNTLLDNAKLATSTKEIQNLRSQLSAMRSEIKATNLSGLTLGDTFKKTFKRASELFAGTGGIMLLTQQLREAWNEALTLDKSFTDLIKVQDELSRGDYPDYLEQCNKKAQDLATTQKSLIDGAEEFSKSGYDLTTSNKLTKQSTVLSNVGEMTASDSAKAIISGVQAYDVVDGYSDVVDKAQALIDKYNEIGNTASITTAEIAEGVQSVGSVFEDANTDVNEFIALLAAGNRQYQDADSLALGLRTAALRIRGCTVELEQMGEETDGVYTSASKLQEKIADLTNINGSGGVKILEADQKTFRSIYDIFVDISKVYKEMSDVDQSALLELIAGKHRASAISATLNNMSEAQEIYQRSLESAGSAQEEYDKYLESSEAALNRFKASMTETYQSVISGETVTGLLNCGNATLQFVDSLGLVESTLKGLVAIGVVKAITTLSTAFKASAINASNFGTALNTVKNMSTMARGTTEYVNALKALKTVSVGLSEAQLKQVLSNKALSDSDSIAVLRTTGLTKAQAQAKLVQMGLTQSTKAQTAANASATASTFSLTAAVKGFAYSVKAAFMSNPVGISIMALSTIFGAISSKVSEYNEKLRETRQADMDAATSAKEKADTLRDLYVQYENLNGITNKTSSQEEQLKQVVIDITKALGDKASALESLTAGTDEYTSSLKEATKAELESQYSTAKIGAKAAEEELKDLSYSKWDGSQITIQQNEQMTGVKEHMAALEAVKEILAEYEDMGRNGMEWEPVNWDENKDDMNAVVEYYNALIEARNKLVIGDNADFLMSSDIYEDINNTINELSDSVEKYTEQQYEAMKLNYEWQNGIPTTEEEFRKMEDSILKVSGAGKEYQDIIKGYLSEDFATFSESIENNIDDAVDSIENATQSLANNQSFADAWEELKNSSDDATKDLADNLTTMAEEGRLTAEALLEADESEYFKNLGISAEEAVEKINKLVDSATQLNTLSSQISKMADMLADKKNGTTASASDLAGFDATIKGLESWEEFERVMGNSKSTMEECQKEANSLATEWINSGNYLENLTDDNKEYYVTQLDMMGIENARAIIEDRLTQIHIQEKINTEELNTALNKLSSAKKSVRDSGQNMLNTIYGEIAGLCDEQNATQDTIKAIFNLVAEQTIFSNQQLNTTQKITALQELAYAFGLTADAARTAYDVEARINQARAESLADPRKGGQWYLKEVAKIQTEASTAYADAIAKQFKKSTPVSYKVDTSNSSSGSSGSSSSDTKTKETKFSETIDWAANSIENLENKISSLESKLNDTTSVSKKRKILEDLISAYEDYEKLEERNVKNKETRYSNALSKLSKSDQKKYQSLIESDTVLKKETFKDEKTYNKVKNAQDAWKALKDAEDSYRESLEKTAEAERELIQVDIDQNNNNIERNQFRLDEVMDRIDNGVGSDDDYTEAESRIKRINELNNENLEIYKDQESQMREDGQVGSKLWRENKSNIDKTKQSIREYNKELASIPIKKLEQENAELQKQLDIVEKLEEKYEKVGSAFSKVISDQIDTLNDQKEAIEESYSSQIDAIEAIEESYSSQINAIEAIEESYSSQIDSIQDEIDALQDSNDERERAIALEKAKYELERAKSQKTKKVLRNGEWTYEADESAIRDAQNSVDDALYNNQIAFLNKQKEDLEKVQEGLNKQKEDLEKVQEDLNKQKEELEKSKENALKPIEDQIDELQKYADRMDDILNKYQETVNDSIAKELFGEDYAGKLLAMDSSILEQFEKELVTIQTQQGILTEQIEENESLIEQAQEIVAAWDGASKELDTKLEEINKIVQEGLDNSEDVQKASKNISSLKSSYNTSATAISDDSSKMKKSIEGDTDDIIEAVNELHARQKEIANEESEILSARKIRYSEFTDDICSMCSRIVDSCNAAISSLAQLSAAQSTSSSSSSSSAYANGTKSSKKEKALVGEEDPEIVLHKKKNTYEYIQSPTVVNLDAGDVVYNGEETKNILNRDGVNLKKLEMSDIASKFNSDIFESFSNSKDFTFSRFENILPPNIPNITPLSSETNLHVDNISLPNVKTSDDARLIIDALCNLTNETMQVKYRK